MQFGTILALFFQRSAGSAFLATFWCFGGARGSRCGAPGRTLGHPNFEGFLHRKPVSVGDPKSAEKWRLKRRLLGPKPTNTN